MALETVQKSHQIPENPKSEAPRIPISIGNPYRFPSPTGPLVRPQPLRRRPRAEAHRAGHAAGRREGQKLGRQLRGLVQQLSA